MKKRERGVQFTYILNVHLIVCEYLVVGKKETESALKHNIPHSTLIPHYQSGNVCNVLLTPQPENRELHLSENQHTS